MIVDMKKLILPFALLFVLSACDSRDFDSDTFGPSNITVFDVAYAVSGTYAECTISYVAQDKTIETEISSLPWSKESFPVTVRGTLGLFNASVSATCRDNNRLGKSSVSVSVDGQLKSRGARTGFNETAEAQYVLINSVD